MGQSRDVILLINTKLPIMEIAFSSKDALILFMFLWYPGKKVCLLVCSQPQYLITTF